MNSPSMHAWPREAQVWWIPACRTTWSVYHGDKFSSAHYNFGISWNNPSCICRTCTCRRLGRLKPLACAI
jgi:hypothetical protein